MNASSEKADYLMIFRDTDWHRDLSPEEIQIIMTDWMGWFNRLMAEGRCKGGQSLGSEGRVVTGKERLVSDGPFAEAKEAVAGYFLLHVDGLEEALEIAKQCPALTYGMSVEVRPAMASCRASQLSGVAPATA